MSEGIAGTSVFLVEDESLIAMLIEDMIEDLGCIRCGTASTVALALAMLQDIRPDIAVLDINVAGDPVFPVCERLSELAIPFIFSTGYGEPGVPPEWRNCAVLQKPYDKPELASAIARGLDPA